MRRKAWLSLGGLILLWGLLLIVVSAVLPQLGLGGGMPAMDEASAFRLALGNSVALLLTFGLSAGLYYSAWKDALKRPPLAFTHIRPATWGWIALLMLGLQAALPWLALDAESLDLPPAWKPIEDALEATESRIETMILSLLTHGSLGWNLLFLAVVPGVVEELFFRGALQGLLIRLTRPAIAIWVTAFVFSAIHGQIYGFVPRLLLGGVMGYLAFYGQSLIPAIWAHFLNNAYATLGGYIAIHLLNTPQYIRSDYKPPVWIALVGAAIAGAAGYQVYRLLRRRG